MQLSKRIQQITTDGSDGWEILYKSRAMIAKGQDVLELTIGEHDIRTDPTILAAMHQSALGGHTGYASVPGTPELRRAVAARIQERTGVPTSHKNVLIPPGDRQVCSPRFYAPRTRGTVLCILTPIMQPIPPQSARPVVSQCRLKRVLKMIFNPVLLIWPPAAMVRVHS